MCLGKRHRTKRNLHRSGKLRKDHNMKKNIVAVLLVIALSTFAVYAVDDASFQVETSVTGINKMKITDALFPANGTPSSFDSADVFVGPLEVETYGSQSFTAYLSTMSNNRGGYTVTMDATAMKSTETDEADAYINYTVTVNSVSLETNGAADLTPVTIIDEDSLAGRASQSHQIFLTVDQITFEAAVEGTYQGTVTFNYTAN